MLRMTASFAQRSLGEAVSQSAFLYTKEPWKSSSAPPLHNGAKGKAAPHPLCTKEPREKRFRNPLSFTQRSLGRHFPTSRSLHKGPRKGREPERIIRPSLYREPSGHAFFAHRTFGVRPFLKTGVYLSSFTGLIPIKYKQMFVFLEKVGRKSWTNGKDVR